jgi:hypothetical protein
MTSHLRTRGHHDVQCRTVLLSSGMRNMRDFRLPQRWSCDPRSSGMLTWPRSVADYRRSGTAYRSHLQGSIQEEWRLGNNVPKRHQPTTDLRFVTRQSSEGLSQKYFVHYVIIVAWGYMARGGKWDSNKYSHAPHNDVSVNDGPHIRRWSHNKIL